MAVAPEPESLAGAAGFSVGLEFDMAAGFASVVFVALGLGASGGKMYAVAGAFEAACECTVATPPNLLNASRKPFSALRSAAGTAGDGSVAGSVDELSGPFPAGPVCKTVLLEFAGLGVLSLFVGPSDGLAEEAVFASAEFGGAAFVRASCVKSSASVATIEKAPTLVAS